MHNQYPPSRYLSSPARSTSPSGLTISTTGESSDTEVTISVEHTFQDVPPHSISVADSTQWEDAAPVYGIRSRSFGQETQHVLDPSLLRPRAQSDNTGFRSFQAIYPTDEFAVDDEESDIQLAPTDTLSVWQRQEPLPSPSPLSSQMLSPHWSPGVPNLRVNTTHEVLGAGWPSDQLLQQSTSPASPLLLSPLSWDVQSETSSVAPLSPTPSLSNPTAVSASHHQSAYAGGSPSPYRGSRSPRAAYDIISKPEIPRRGRSETRVNRYGGRFVSADPSVTGMGRNMEALSIRSPSVSYSPHLHSPQGQPTQQDLAHTAGPQDFLYSFALQVSQTDEPGFFAPYDASMQASASSSLSPNHRLPGPSLAPIDFVESETTLLFMDSVSDPTLDAGVSFRDGTDTQAYGSIHSETIINDHRGMLPRRQPRRRMDHSPYPPQHRGIAAENYNQAQDVDPVSQWDGQLSPENAMSLQPLRPVATDATVRAAYARRKDPSKPGAFVCEFCQHDFTSKHNWKNHMNAHRDIKQFVCKCGERFVTGHTLKRHALKCASEDGSLPTWKR